MPRTSPPKIDDRILTFICEFANGLNEDEAAAKAGLPLSECRRAFLSRKAHKRVLEREFADRLAIYDLVPVSIIRAKILGVLANEKNPPSARVAAAKLLVDLLTGADENAAKNVGELIRTLRRSGAPDDEKNTEKVA